MFNTVSFLNEKKVDDAIKGFEPLDDCHMKAYKLMQQNGKLYGTYAVTENVIDGKDVANSCLKARHMLNKECGVDPEAEYKQAEIDEEPAIFCVVSRIVNMFKNKKYFLIYFYDENILFFRYDDICDVYEIVINEHDLIFEGKKHIKEVNDMYSKRGDNKFIAPIICYSLD